MMLTRTSILIVEWAPQNGCCQQLHSKGVAIASWLSRSLCKVRNSVSPRFLSNFCLCAGPQSVGNFVYASRVKFLFPVALWFGYTQAPPAFKAIDSGGSFFQCRTSELGAWCGSGTPQSLQLWLSSYFGVVYPGGMSWIYCISTPPTHLLVVPSLYVYLWRIFSVSLWLILTGCFFINSCHLVFCGWRWVQGLPTLLSWPHLRKIIFEYTYISHQS